MAGRHYNCASTLNLLRVYECYNPARYACSRRRCHNDHRLLSKRCLLQSDSLVLRPALTQGWVPTRRSGSYSLDYSRGTPCCVNDLVNSIGRHPCASRPGNKFAWIRKICYTATTRRHTTALCSCVSGSAVHSWCRDVPSSPLCSDLFIIVELRYSTDACAPFRRTSVVSLIYRAM